MLSPAAHPVPPATTYYIIMSKLTTQQKRRLARAYSRAASAELAAQRERRRYVRHVREVREREFKRLRAIALIVSLPFVLLLAIVLFVSWYVLVVRLLWNPSSLIIVP